MVIKVDYLVEYALETQGNRGTKRVYQLLDSVFGTLSPEFEKLLYFFCFEISRYSPCSFWERTVLPQSLDYFCCENGIPLVVLNFNMLS